MAVSGVVIAKALVPVVLVGGGVAAYVTAPDDAAGAAQLWIDSPTDTARLDPGTVAVVAHAADGLDVDELTLVVDGKDVATKSDLTAYNRLAGVQFSWTATNGYHFLVVKGGGHESEKVAVNVGEASALGTPGLTTGPKPTRKPSASASSSPSATATTTGPTGGPTVVRTTPTSKPTTKPPSDPVIRSVAITPNDVYAGRCVGAITVKASVQGATGGSAQVVGTGVDKFIGGSVSGGTFTATFKQRDLNGTNLTGSYQVEVTVTNATGFDVGAATVTIACGKD